MAIQLTGNDQDPIPNETLVAVSGGSADPQFRPKVAASLRTGKDWNPIEIEFRGPHFTVTINGQRVLDVRVDEAQGSGNHQAGPLQKSGRIALECRRGHVEFRKVEIEQLAPATGQ